MTLGNAAAARVRLIVWCKGCGHQVEPDPVEIAERYGADHVPEWHERFICSSCGSRNVDIVVTGPSGGSVSRPAYLNLPADRSRPFPDIPPWVEMSGLVAYIRHLEKDDAAFG
jgi:hypothetical protein